MTTHFSISDIQTDESTLSRRTTVRIGTSGDVKFQTPMKTGTNGVTELPLYEAYRRIKPTTISQCLKSETEDRAYGKNLRKSCKGQFNILNIEYGDREVVPTTKMVEALSDMQYIHTDVIATPSWFDLITRKNSVDSELYLKLSKTFIDAAATRNHKPIMGTIPQSIPPENLEQVIDFYVDNNVTSFIVDSHGRTLLSGMWVRSLQRSLDRYNIERECLLYTINAYQGTVRRNVEEIEAKDFLGFTAGFDILGGKHVAKFSNGSESSDYTPVGRKFKSDTYTYEKCICSPEERLRISDQTVRDQNAELGSVRKVIAEGEMKSHLEGKQLSQETLDMVFSLRDNGRTMTLDDFI